MAHSSPPSAPDLNAAQRESLLEQLRTYLPEELYQQVQRLLIMLWWIQQVLAEKKISLQRLPQVFLRSRSEKASRLFPKEETPDSETDVGGKSKTKSKRKGHGRKKTADYPGAKRVPVPHPSFRVGDLCPQCLQGKLYLLKLPAQLLWIMARPMFEATIYELQRLRCALCGALFTAPAPPPVAAGKYDPSVGTMLAVLRYGAGLPMYRIEKWQAYFGVPMAASTQWELSLIHI